MKIEIIGFAAVCRDDILLDKIGSGVYAFDCRKGVEHFRVHNRK